jgi:hypothetical protein
MEPDDERRRLDAALETGAEVMELRTADEATDAEDRADEMTDVACPDDARDDAPETADDRTDDAAETDTTDDATEAVDFEWWASASTPRRR